MLVHITAQSKILFISELILCKGLLYVSVLMIWQPNDQISSWLPEINVIEYLFSCISIREQREPRVHSQIVRDIAE